MMGFGFGNLNFAQPNGRGDIFDHLGNLFQGGAENNSSPTGNLTDVLSGLAAAPQFGGLVNLLHSPLIAGAGPSLVPGPVQTIHTAPPGPSLGPAQPVGNDVPGVNGGDVHMPFDPAPGQLTNPSGSGQRDLLPSGQMGLMAFLHNLFGNNNHGIGNLNGGLASILPQPQEANPASPITGSNLLDHIAKLHHRRLGLGFRPMGAA